ncbi:hypothetical protein HMF8227_00016 [Saliniradius amylolyticus]|uniref:HTH arsR-type domain-containing protein n=1 Tax=Saliniradius amylolyticus TaxID=2183582 RepID=A0A2S2DZT8_9ALTE|nr:metalloregulator ArsR/SmtB family transcription factor [Saliniradius amylolyticus]AWL10530.1 hypothetical protein HMF8227_00016 [Saliniradius amylolyticus]
MADSQTNSDKILYLLKTGGEQTARQLADALGMTPMGARQHLLQLQQNEYVTSRNKAEKVGRPAQYWSLTPKASERFPDTHSSLTLSLLDSAKDLYGEQGLVALLKNREQQMRQHYLQALKGQDSLEQQLQTLATLRTQEGYMAEWHQAEAGYVFIENHCPICAAASHCQQLCDSELALFQACLGPEVNIRRDEHILKGQRRCCYRIEPISDGR